MVEVEVIVEHFRGSLTPDDKLWNKAGDIVFVSDEAGDVIKKHFPHWFKIIRKTANETEEKAIEESPTNKMVEPKRVSRKKVE